MSDASTAVEWLLQQAEPEARRVAVRQIAKVNGSEAVELLIRALGDEDWRVRKEAAAVAPQLQRRDEVVAGLIAALEDLMNIGLRNAAVEALVAIGPDAVSATVEVLQWSDADARKLAIEVLGGLADLRGTKELARALDDEDSNVRVAAAEALGNAALAGEDAREIAIRSLVESLATQDSFLKIAVLESLSRLEARLPWSVFEAHAKDPLLRRYAIAAAAHSHELDAVRVLAEATGDPSTTIAREAIVALGNLVAAQPSEAGLLEATRDALRSTPVGRANTRRAALDAEDLPLRNGALPLLGLAADVRDVPLLVDALGENVAERAVIALHLFGSDAVGAMLAASRSARPTVRAAALEIAASFEGIEPELVHRALHEALGDASFEVVATAIEILGPVGDADDLRRIAPLVGHANERIAAAASSAVWTLASSHVGAARLLLGDPRLGSDPLALSCILLGAIAVTQALREEDIVVLKRALAHDRPQVRRAAIEALAQAGGEAASDSVVFALADEERDVQLAALRALGRLGLAAPLVAAVADARDPVLTSAALQALGEAAPVRAVEVATPLVNHPDMAVACAAVEALGHLAASSASAGVVVACEDALFSALDRPEPEIVKLALSLVGAQPGPRPLARLGLCLDHRSWQVRRAAAELLGQTNEAGAQALLRARYEREKDSNVRDAIASAVSVRPPPRTSSTPRPEAAGRREGH